MMVLALLLILMWSADALRLRARLARFTTLDPAQQATAETAAGWTALTLPGLDLPKPLLRSAIALAESRGLLAVDLIPASLHVEGLMGLLAIVDPDTETTDPFGSSASACHALLVANSELQHLPAIEHATDLQEALRRMRSRAPMKVAHLRAPDLAAARPDPIVSPAVRRGQFYRFLGPLLAMQVWMFALLAACIALAPAWGIAALLVFHLQPIVVVGGQQGSRGAVGALLWRAPWHLWAILRAAVDSTRPDPKVEALRESYAQDMAEGLDGFFEAPRDTCPLCESTSLRKRLVTKDLHQHKAGTFRLDRCLDCGHIFQNPRLSFRGLDFYYRDFYDGLGARAVDAVFSLAGNQYDHRATIVAPFGPPKRWLDVGGGHGHFCFLASTHWPETQFEALDLSSSVEEAQARGWVSKGWRGLFPDLEPQLAAQEQPYDVISMSHYLEHTREPQVEIATAGRLLPAGGLLMIELPDPESRLQYLVGRRWMPWFQPQHQHFLSVPNLTRLCAQEGLELVAEHRAEAHQAVDFFAASWMVLNALAPEPTPWQTRPGLLGAMRNALVHLTLSWILLPAALMDRLIEPLAKHSSNTYRVLYRKSS